ncbi:PCMD domain-containing protein [uncultured Bacteroides sp.]|uniref:PCMD domain-containing protein n=1 Tax=uncultured Bacteroides sp. TaxID=162156 RepID=UPI002623E606|nr:PCMD domain-containing protein [uncultured Bacteroides sp.]
MRIRNLLSCLFLSILAVSCIKDEALNSEADIETCTLSGDVLNREPIIENDKVTLILKKGTDLTALAPQFTLTPGATIIPASGSTLDFTSPQTYVVTSEDKKWQKSYKVSATTSAFTTTRYNFENVRFFSDNHNKDKYQIFYETDQQGRENMTWASGNPGFAMTGVEGNYSIYPTFQADNGINGSKCLGLTTRLTGNLGNLMNMPLASGNLFIGTFDVMNALTNALTATQFGMQFEYIPTYLKGYYKYKAGDTFYIVDRTSHDKIKPVPGEKDAFDIYAVFYESTEKLPVLDGTNILDENTETILAVARIEKGTESSEWKEFYLPFNFREGKKVDPVKLAAGKYNLTIVFASSVRGNYFEGAPGSTLYIDEVELGYEESETNIINTATNQ